MANQGSQVDRLVTQNFDLHGRRAVNAAASKSPTDYVIQDELTAATSYKTLKKFIDKVTSLEAFVFSKVATFIGAVTFRAAIIVSILRPLTNSTSAIKITKADGTTAVITIDTTTPEVVINNANARVYNSGGISRIYIGQTSSVKRLQLAYVASTDTAVLSSENGGTFKHMTLDANTLFFNASSNGPISIGSATSTLAFFAATPVAQQSLNAYTTNSQSSAYVSTPAALAQAATLADLNTLRTAYENLRASYDDLRTKLKTTTLVL